MNVHSPGQLTSIDLVPAKGKTKVNWLISFHSLIRQCFNILIRLCNPLRIRNIKIERSKQLYHNNTLPLFSPLPKLGQWMWHQLNERIYFLVAAVCTAAIATLPRCPAVPRQPSRAWPADADDISVDRHGGVTVWPCAYWLCVDLVLLHSYSRKMNNNFIIVITNNMK